MQYQGDGISNAELCHQSRNILDVFIDGKAVWPAVIQLVGAPSRQIRSDQSTTPFQMRHDISLQLRGCRDAVLKHDQVPASVLDVGRLLALYGGKILRVTRLV